MTKYIQPRDRSELMQALGELTAASRVIAGGTDLMVEIREDRPDIDVILSLSAVEDLRGISLSPDGKQVRIGAMETHDRIARDPVVRKYFAALSEACASVGSQQIRNRGTIGGNLCNASPADDTAPCVHLFGGEIETLDANGGSRRIPMAELVTGFGSTCLGAGEIITAIWLPVNAERKSTFVKLGSRKSVTISQISMAVSWETGGSGAGGGADDFCVKSADGYLGAVSLRPIHVPECGEILRTASADEAEALAAALGGRIREIRENRKTPSKTKITEAEQLYKERAARAVADDVCCRIRAAAGVSCGAGPAVKEQ